MLTDYKKRLRTRGIPTLLAAAVLIVLFMGFNHYMEIREDDVEAHKLMERELRIAVLTIMSELSETETAINDMGMMAGNNLSHPDRICHYTMTVLNKSTFIQAAAIAFVPDYYKARGRWFEPRSTRVGDKIRMGQIGGADHDYFKMDWYAEAMADTTSDMRWSDPYIDHSQNDILIMSLTRPLYDSDGKRVAVLCIDVSLNSLKKLLKSVEPYPGSVCQLLNEDKEVVVSSNENKDEDANEDCFTETMPVAYQGGGSNGHATDSPANLYVRLSCPKSAIYSSTTTLNVIMLGLLLLGILLLAYIVQRGLRYMMRLNIAIGQQQAMENELRIAHDIQMNMLRRDFPDCLWAKLQPMKEVGGDLYDFYQKDDTLFFIIGDVSGKGLPAAMMMASTVELFRMAARHYDTSKDIVSEINHVLSEHNPKMIFVTAFVGKIDTAHGLLTYCNAGHNPPILNGLPVSTDPDIPIGYDAEYAYRQHSAMFATGSRMTLYTDGITEARDAEGKFMGVERLRQAIGECRGDSMERMVECIMKTVEGFTAGCDARDDITLMCIANDVERQSPTIRISNKEEELRRVKTLLREYCGLAGMNRKQTEHMVLAVEEAVSNVINYAYPDGTAGEIDVDFNVDESQMTEGADSIFTIVIKDSGKPFDPLSDNTVGAEQAVTSRQVGGLGIMLYQKLMDTVEYERTPDGYNVLTMTKIINNEIINS